MKISGIITEYNPFHNGHKYQIEKTKEFSDAIISVMSSSFTQRGTPSIINKFTRAQIAVNNGVDLVIELPVIYSSSNAEIFSKGGVFLLNSLGVLDYLVFGTEDELQVIQNINKKIHLNNDIFEKNIKKYLKDGNSFLIAKEKAMDFLTENEKEILKKPNNILAFEYLKALCDFNSAIKPIAIKRHMTNHNSNISYNKFSSGSKIRSMVLNGNLENVKDFVPIETFNALKKEKYNEFNNYFDIFKYIIISGKLNYEKYFDYEKGLENRFLKYLESENIDAFINNISTKRYTKARISRLINNILLDIDKDFVRETFNHKPYIRILAMNKTGIEILREIKKNNDIYIINKFAKYKESDDSIINEIAEKEIYATDIYNIFGNKIMGEDFIFPTFRK